jgi:hypothetical protein
VIEFKTGKAISIVDDLTKVKEMGLSSLDFVQIYQHGIPLKISKTMQF